MSVDLSKLISLDELTVFKAGTDALYETKSNVTALANRVKTLEDVGSDDNTIETVKVNGTALTPDANKAVDITVPTKLSDLTNDNNTVTDSSYTHTDNNFTDSLKDKLTGIASGAEVNVIDTITVGGNAASVVNKTVALGNAATATTESTLTDGSNLPTGAAVKAFVEGKGYQTASDVSTAVEAYGYQDAEDVADIVEAYGYQTASDVSTALTNSGYQANVIEGVQVNGTDLALSSKKANIAITAGDSGVGTLKVNGVTVTAYGLGAAAAKGLASAGVADGENGLVTGDEVHDYVAGIVSSTFKPGGSKTATQLVTTGNDSLLIAANEGKVYNLSDTLTLNSTTAALFVDGVSGNSYPAGTNVVVLDAGSGSYKFDVQAGFIDLSGYVLASQIGLATTAQIQALFSPAA